MRELLLALPHRQSRWLLLIAALAGTGLVASGFLLPLFSQLFTDHYLVAGHRDWLGGLLLGMALATLLRAALTWLQRRLLLRIQLAAARALNRSTFTALLNVEPQALTHLALGSSGFLLRRQQRALALLYNEVAQGFADLPGRARCAGRRRRSARRRRRAPMPPRGRGRAR
jgi:ABC-type bacteriocin/lantibiotic exporter with double-glycine peptidase domain